MSPHVMSDSPPRPQREYRSSRVAVERSKNSSVLSPEQIEPCEVETERFRSTGDISGPELIEHLFRLAD